jgi:hypothetical protein
MYYNLISRALKNRLRSGFSSDSKKSRLLKAQRRNTPSKQMSIKDLEQKARIPQKISSIKLLREKRWMNFLCLIGHVGTKNADFR